MKTKVKLYCREARKSGHTCRDAMVFELLKLPSSEWSSRFSDSEVAVASRIIRES